MRVTCIIVSLIIINFQAMAQKEVIVGQPADTTYLTLNGKDNTDAIHMDNDKMRVRHHFDFLVTDRDFLRILLDADNNQTNAIFSIYKDTTAGGSLIPPVRFSLDGYASWINSGNFGIGDINPLEKLSVDGAIKIGPNNFNTDGVIRYQGNAFEGYTNGAWRSLTEDADADPTNEVQELILTGNKLKISNSNFVLLPFQEIKDADADTYITAENSPDDDKISFGLGNQNRLSLAKTTGSGRTYMSFPNNDNNILIGVNGANTASTGVNNTYIGSSTATFNQNGSENIMIGNGTGLLNNQNENIYIGNSVGTLNANDENVVIGNSAGNTGTFDQSVFIGFEAGKNATASNCTYIGRSSGQATDGDNNTFLGDLSGGSCESGSNNTVLGANAAEGMVSASGNTYVGQSAGGPHGSGSNNTCIGFSSGLNFSFIDNSIALGYDALNTASYEAVIGETGLTSIGGYEPWTNFSDGRFKSKLHQDVPGLIFINQLKPVTYHLEARALDQSLHKNDREDMGKRSEEQLIKKEQIVYSGFIAQEVEATAQSIGYDFSGVDKPQNENDYYGLRYGMFTVPLVKAVQELSAQNDLMAQEIELLKEKNTALENQLNIRLATLEAEVKQMNIQKTQ